MINNYFILGSLILNIIAIILLVIIIFKKKENYFQDSDIIQEIDKLLPIYETQLNILRGREYSTLVGGTEYQQNQYREKIKKQIYELQDKIYLLNHKKNILIKKI